LPRVHKQQTIAGHWREILQPGTSIYENFFELGDTLCGDGQVVLRMQKAFQVDISYSSFLLNNTIIAALANIADTTTFKGLQSEHPIVRVSISRYFFCSAQDLWF